MLDSNLSLSDKQIKMFATQKKRFVSKAMSTRKQDIGLFSFILGCLAA
jgi:hypothetical protein